MKRILVALLLFGLLTPAAAIFHGSAGSSPSQFVNPAAIGGGGWLVGIDINPTDGTAHARSDGYGVYHWTGTSWDQLMTTAHLPTVNSGYYPRTNSTSQISQNWAGVEEVTSAPSNSSIVYIYYGGFLFKKTNTSLPDIARVCNPTIGGTGNGAQSTFSFAGSNGPLRMNGRKMAVDPINPNIVYIGTDANGMFETNDGGTTCAQVTSLPTQTCNQTTPGATCPNYNIAFDPSSATITCPIVGGSCTSIVYAFGGTSLYVSVDAGATWNTVTSGGPTAVEHLVVAPFGGAVWLIDGATTGFIWQYSGGGASGTWTKYTAQGGGFHSIAVNPDPAKVSGGNSQHIVAGTLFGNLLVSASAGSAWSSSQTTSTRVATDVPWLQASASQEIGLSNGDMQFYPNSVSPNTLGFGEGVGFWLGNPPTAAVGGLVTWTSQTAGVENLVAQDAIAPNGILIAGTQDRATYYRGNLPNYALTQNTTYQNNAFSLNVSWGIDWASTNSNVLVTNTSGSSVVNNNSGSSTDGGQTWFPFNSYYTTIPASGLSSGTGGVIKVTVASTTGLTAWSAGPSGSTGSMVRIEGYNRTTTTQNTNIERYWPIQNVTATTFELIGSVFSGCSCTTGLGNYYIYVDTNPLSTNADGYQITGIGADSNGLINVQVVNTSSSISNFTIVCLSGVLGTVEANGCWQTTNSVNNTVNPAGGNGSFSLLASIFVNAWTPNTGVATKIIPDGGSIASASPNNIMLIGSNQDYPFCSTDGGQTWIKVTPPGVPVPVSISGASWSGGQITLTTSSAPAGMASGQGFYVWGMTPTAYNGTYVATTGTAGSTIVANLASNPGTATGFGSTVVSSNRGWVNSAFLWRNILAADRVNANTIYMYNYNGGLFESVNCATPTLVSNFIIPNGTFNLKIRSVPGYAGHLFSAPGPQGAEPGALHPSPSAALRRMIVSGGTGSWSTIANVSEARGVAIGAIAPGSDYPTVYLDGWVDLSDGNGPTYGIWRTSGTAAQWASGSGTGTSLTWTKVTDYPNGWFDTNNGVLTANGVTWNQWFAGYNGSGFKYGQQNFLLERDINPASNDNSPVGLAKAA